MVRDGVSGLLVDSHSDRDWANAIRRVITDDGFRASLSAGAIEQSHQFAWEHTAERTIEVYRQAARAMREELVG